MRYIRRTAKRTTMKEHLFSGCGPALWIVFRGRDFRRALAYRYMWQHCEMNEYCAISTRKCLLPIELLCMYKILTLVLRMTETEEKVAGSRG
jgi:hypothetical protein